MKILVVGEHIRDDVDRYTFYNNDDYHYYKKHIIYRVFSQKNKLAQGLNLLLTALHVRYSSHQADIIISINPRVGFWVALINTLTFSNKLHIIWSFNIKQPYKGFILFFARNVFKKIKKFIVYSQHERTLYSKMLLLPPEKFVYKFFSGPYLEDQRYINLVEKADKENYIVSAGFSGRNYELLAKVASKMQSTTFIVITYPSSIKNINFPKNVKIVSNISELEYCRYIANAKAMFLPIKNKETANGHIGIVQAMSLKTLLVTNMTEGTKDYLQPNENCIIFPDTDVNLIVEIITNIVQDQVEATQIINKAYLFAKEHFSVEKEIELINNLKLD